MKKRLIAVFGAGVLSGVVIVIATLKVTTTLRVFAVEKSHSRVVLENEQVRVKEAVFAPGDQKPGMHTHEYPHVGVVIDGGMLKFNYPDGKTETLDLKRGGVGYREANVTHEAVNLGKKPMRVIEVEIK